MNIFIFLLLRLNRIGEEMSLHRLSSSLFARNISKKKQNTTTTISNKNYKNHVILKGQ